MGQVLHGSATTTEAVRRAIQHSQESLRALAGRYGINPKTVAKWKKRFSAADLPTGPKEPRSTVLSVEDEAVIVAFRKHTLLPLDDCLYALQATIPQLTRSSLHRCLQRHGIGRLPTPRAECMGRSRGGLTTKIHALVDANGMPITIKLTEGQAHDGRSAADMLDNLQPGQILLADRAYDSNALREAMTAQGALGEHPADGPQTGPARVQPLPVSLQEPGRALLQQAQALPRDRHPLRETRDQLPRPRQARSHPHLVAT